MHRWVSIVVGFVICAGCATPPAAPEVVRFSALAAGAERVTLVDKRGPQDREPRILRGNGEHIYLGDAAMQPAVLDLIAAKLASSVPGAYRNVPIEILRVDVGFWNAASPGSQMGPLPMVQMPGAPVGAVIVGNLLGHGIVHLLKGGGYSKTYAVAELEISVGGHRIASMDTVPLQEGDKPEQALEKALASGLATLAEKVSTMKHWTQASEK
jgi:hypothetical protein